MGTSCRIDTLPAHRTVRGCRCGESDDIRAMLVFNIGQREAPLAADTPLKRIALATKNSSNSKR